MRALIDVFCNFHWIECGEMARSAQPYAGMLKPLLRRHRIRSVINLRGCNPHFRWWRQEITTSKSLSVWHYDLSMNSRALPSQAFLLSLLRLYSVSKKPVLIKCSGGQDRTSFAAALYVVHRGGWATLSNAPDQFRFWPYLHFPKQQQRWMRAFFLYAQELAGSLPLARWIEDRYSPEDFMAWLDDRGLEQSFRNLPELPPRVLESHRTASRNEPSRPAY